jgi:hypothetical protein
VQLDRAHQARDDVSLKGRTGNELVVRNRKKSLKIEVDVPASPDIIEFRIKFRKIEMASSYVYYRLTHASLQKVAAFEKI